jgi:hypothetical protein
MSIEQERLISLIEFAQQSARLKSKPASTIAQYSLFAIYEHNLQGLPGIRLNVNDTENSDEIWLVVERMHERKPPEITNAMLYPWVQMAQGPMDEPKLLEVVDGARLIAAGTHRSSREADFNDKEISKPLIDPQAMVMLVDYGKASQIKVQFSNYLATKWNPWAEEEKLRRKTIRLYSQLFTLKQQLEGGIVEAQLELVWGVGLGIWNSAGVCD